MKTIGDGSSQANEQTSLQIGGESGDRFGLWELELIATRTRVLNRPT